MIIFTAHYDWESEDVDTREPGFWVQLGRIAERLGARLMVQGFKDDGGTVELRFTTRIGHDPENTAVADTLKRELEDSLDFTCEYRVATDAEVSEMLRESLARMFGTSVDQIPQNPMDVVQVKA